MRAVLFVVFGLLASFGAAHAQPGPEPINIFAIDQRFEFDTIRLGEEDCVPLLFENTEEIPVIVEAYSSMWSWDTTNFVVRDRHPLPDTLAPGQILTMGTMCFHPSWEGVPEYSVDYEMKYRINGERGSTMFTFRGAMTEPSAVQETTMEDVRVVNRGASIAIVASMPCDIQVLDLLGRECATAQLSGSEWTSSSLRSGTYIVRVTRLNSVRSYKTQVL